MGSGRRKWRSLAVILLESACPATPTHMQGSMASAIPVLLQRSLLLAIGGEQEGVH